MHLSPQDENGIVLMILRDTYDILSRTPNFSFNYNAKVKLQKVVFLVADSLEIPLTRSWYRYGPYIHNENVDFEALPETLNETTMKEIRNAEKVFSDRQQEYTEVLSSLVPRIFFLELHSLLTEIYTTYAPKQYKTVYLANLAIEENFRLAKSQTDIEIDNFTQHFSTFASSVVGFDDMSFVYDHADEYATILDNFLIKMDRMGEVSLPHLRMLKSSYESILWNPISLKISINTLIGLNAEEERLKQWSKLNKASSQMKNRLASLDASLSRDNVLASVDEKTEFYKAKYGDDKQFLDAVTNVWKSYK
jgi:hypothetical protein